MDSPRLVQAASRLLAKRLIILGYSARDYPEDTRALASLRQHHQLLDSYADFAYQLHVDGSFSGQLDEPVLREARNLQIAPLVLFHNFNGAIFDPQPLRSVLSSPQLQRTCIGNILQLVPPDAAGAHIDFEAMPAGQRLTFVGFLETLQTALHARGQLLTIALPPKRFEHEAPGYDFAGIGRVCDLITIMTYDEHYAGGSPGPVASLPWMTQVLDYAIGLLPRHKILVGIPVYGYDWSQEPTRLIPMRDIPELVAQTGARILWSDTDVEPYFYYWRRRMRHTVWFENEISTKIRFGLVKSYRIRGIAIWRLGFATRGFWQGVRAKLK